MEATDLRETPVTDNVKVAEAKKRFDPTLIFWDCSLGID